jgi:hypothetical protein
MDSDVIAAKRKKQVSPNGEFPLSDKSEDRVSKREHSLIKLF